MGLGKIRSLGTYHRCIKELHLAGFILYSPSYDPYTGSLVEIIDFDEFETSINKALRGGFFADFEGYKDVFSVK